LIHIPSTLDVPSQVRLDAPVVRSFDRRSTRFDRFRVGVEVALVGMRSEPRLRRKRSSTS
jgi:hypothetical protein